MCAEAHAAVPMRLERWKDVLAVQVEGQQGSKSVVQLRKVVHQLSGLKLTSGADKAKASIAERLRLRCGKW